MSEENKIIKTEQNSIVAINSQISIYNNQITKSANRLAHIFFNQAEELSFRFVGNPNYNGDKVEDAKKANELYLKAIELNSDFQDAYNGYAQNLRLTLKDYTKAIEIYTKLIELNPLYEYAYIRRGFCKRDLKDYRGYLEDFNNSIVNGGKWDEEAFISRSLIKQKLNDYEGVIEDLLEAKKNGNLDAFYFEKLGKAYVEVGNLKQSFVYFEKALKIEEAILDRSKTVSKTKTFPLFVRVSKIYIDTLVQEYEFDKISEIIEKMEYYYPKHPYTIELLEQYNSEIIEDDDEIINFLTDSGTKGEVSFEKLFSNDVIEMIINSVPENPVPKKDILLKQYRESYKITKKYGEESDEAIEQKRMIEFLKHRIPDNEE